MKRKFLRTVQVKKMTIDYRWGLTVDLSKCTGCGACNVACSLENNVPQVGRDQVNMGADDLD